MPCAAYNRNFIHARMKPPRVVFYNFYFALCTGKSIERRGRDRTSSIGDITSDASTSTRTSSYVPLRSASTAITTPTSRSHQFTRLTSPDGMFFYRKIQDLFVNYLNICINVSCFNTYIGKIRGTRYDANIVFGFPRCGIATSN